MKVAIHSTVTLRLIRNPDQRFKLIRRVGEIVNYAFEDASCLVACEFFMSSCSFGQFSRTTQIFPSRTVTFRPSKRAIFFASALASSCEIPVTAISRVPMVRT